MAGAEMKIPTPEELEEMLARGELKLLGAGSRRECYAIPGTNLCLKCYREEGAASNATVAREIRKYRHDEKRNTCAQEYRYWLELKAKLPAYIFAAFPESLELIHLPTRGYALLESRIENADGSPCERFYWVFVGGDAGLREKLLEKFRTLIIAFAKQAVRFYDTQNIVVQNLENGEMRFRVVDFEPTSRTLIQIDRLGSIFVRRKVLARARRFLRVQFGYCSPLF